MPSKPAILITEGDTDDEFLKKLIQFHGITGCSIKDRPKGKNRGGVSYFREQLKSLRTPGIRGKYDEIILVADNDDGTGFENVKEEIRQANFESPAEDQFGIPDSPRVAAKQSQSLPNVSILMLPWDDLPGCLETLCLEATNQKYHGNRQCEADPDFKTTERRN